MCSYWDDNFENFGTVTSPHNLWFLSFVDYNETFEGYSSGYQGFENYKKTVEGEGREG